jgi:hypothetical protein
MKGRTVLESAMWNDFHVARRSDRLRTLSHQTYFKGRWFFSPPLFVKAGDGKNLERTTKIEHFDVFKKDDPDTLPLQLVPPFFETDELAACARGQRP